MSTEQLLKELREMQRSQSFWDMSKQPLWKEAADMIEIISAHYDELLVDRDKWRELAIEQVHLLVNRQGDRQ